MSHIFVHPAPGLGDLLPGFFVVPQNPIKDAGDNRVPYKVPHLGELLPAHFVVPQNPLKDALATVGRGKGDHMAGCGCDGLGSCGCSDRVSLGSLGAFDLASIESRLSGISTTTWMYIGGAALLLLLLTSRGGKGSDYQAAKLQAKLDYQKSLSAAKTRYARVATRLGRGVKAAAAGIAAKRAIA